MTLDRLREFHRKLGALLDDPQPGLFTWCTALHDLVVDFIKAWTSGGIIRS